jgi:hypothetical protein
MGSVRLYHEDSGVGVGVGFGVGVGDCCDAWVYSFLIIVFLFILNKCRL